MQKSWRIAVLIVSLGLTASISHAQDAAEYGIASGNTSTAVQTVKLPPMTVTLTPATPAAKKTASSNLVATVGPPPAEVNRKALESNSGQHAAKLLLRSVPANAEVFVND